MQAPKSGTKSTSGHLDYKWIVTIVVIFGAFMSILDQTIVNIAVPRLQNAFGAGLNSVQWVLTAYILTQGVVTPTTSFFADRLGTKRFYLLALSIFTIGSALCGLAWSLPVLILFRVLQGVGGAFLFPLAITMLYREFPVNQRGLASGIFGIAALLAPAVGPTLGGYFVTYADWPFIFFVNVPIGILAIVLGIFLLREFRPEGHTSFDIPGFVLVAIGLAAVLYALSDASADGWGSVKVVSCLIAGTIFLCLFVIVELRLSNRGRQPLVDLRLFANGLFLTSNIANILITFAFFGGLFLLPVYLQSLRGLNAFQAGLLLLPQAFASIITALIGGRIVDRYGVRVVVVPGLLILSFTLWQLSSVTLSTPYWWLEVLFILRGLALGVIIQPLSVSALTEIRPRQFAQASSLYTVLRFVSTSLGIAVLATLVQAQTKAHYSQLAEQVRSGSRLGQQAIRLMLRQASMLAIQDAFRLTLIVIVAAVVVTALIRTRRRPVAEAQASNDRPEMSAEEEAARTEGLLGA